jgi:hypothetical protein
MAHGRDALQSDVWPLCWTHDQKNSAMSGSITGVSSDDAFYEQIVQFAPTSVVLSATAGVLLDICQFISR